MADGATAEVDGLDLVDWGDCVAEFEKIENLSFEILDGFGGCGGVDGGGGEVEGVR